jgi:multidrug efflux pump subunit AcrA (membrane-fusion protein)
MANFFKRITGIAAIEAEIERTRALSEQATAALAEATRLVREQDAAVKQAQIDAAAAIEEQRIASLAPKERATARGEPWVGVIDTQLNKDDPSNGFFDLDWNEFFITQLRQAGYGEDGDTEESIIDRWFRELARNVLADEGQDTSRRAGSIDVKAAVKQNSQFRR